MTREQILITGIIQGVGFRPLAYKLALKLKLFGFIRNDDNGVEIQIQGDVHIVNKFKKKLLNNLPILAKVDMFKTKQINILKTKHFKIIKSNSLMYQKKPHLKTVSISPDVVICKHCKNDIDSIKKYKLYFSTNCTNCGPRYSIVKTVPYDRMNTSMNKFTLCSSCKKSYKSPLNRRYHAQATSCKKCGPQLTLSYKLKELIFSNEKDTFVKVANLIKEGKIGAIKGIGGFNIVCDSLNHKTIQKLRKYKNRANKPFAIMCKNIKQIKQFAKVSNKEKELLISKESPILILDKLNNAKLKLSGLVSPNINKIGCILPYSSLHYILFKYLNNPIISTSANMANEPIIIKKSDIEKKLPFVDFILDFNRKIINGIDDSVIQVVNNEISTLRLARGYAPKEIKLAFKINKKILAIGADKKNAICLAFEDKIIISPHIGNLHNIKSFNFFNKTIQTFKNFYNFDYDLLLCDKHPNYETSKWTKTQNTNSFKLQHHLAHIYSVKAEFSLKNKYIGFSFDGTGYGNDGKLWGGEVFVNDKRVYHFKNIKLLGGEKAIKEPRRIALSLLFDKYCLDEVLNLNLPVIKQFSKNEIKIFHKMWLENLNAPQSSSVGRLFDAIASLANVCHYQTYEGEAGLLCEIAYNKKCKKTFKYFIKNKIIDIKFDFFDKDLISKFINTLVKITLDLAIKHKLDVILSGGVFANKTLLELICIKLSQKNIKYYYNKKTPINDGGIALGQTYYYLQKQRNFEKISKI